jgi:S-methylmethionine-dependent homocysteine/selenocysteine methylase
MAEPRQQLENRVPPAQQKLLISETMKLARSISGEANQDKRVGGTEKFLDNLKAMSPEQLTEVIALLASYDNNPGAVSKALREGAIIAAEAKNTQLLTDAMAAFTLKSDANAKSIVTATEKFDKKAFWLTWALILLSIIGLLVAVIPDNRKESILKFFHLVK